MFGEKPLSDGWDRAVQGTDLRGRVGRWPTASRSSHAWRRSGLASSGRGDAEDVDAARAAGMDMMHLPDENAAAGVRASQKAAHEAANEAVNAGMRRREAERRGGRPT